MRTPLFLLPLLFVASPAVAQQQPIEVPPALTDPATAGKLANMMEALSEAFLDLRVGQIEAAAEGRQATPADRAKRVRDVADAGELQRQIAESKPMIEHSMKAMARALPAMAKALSEAAVEVERAVENMPRPDYPRR